ncbi:MAG: hypothetical protein MSG78_01970 [Clostridiales bacterium]|nr:hypothetical protein [Clostridiales bacterium]
MEYIFSPAKCPFCNELFYLDSNKQTAYCIHCGQPLNVFTAIANYDPTTDAFLLHAESEEQERMLLHAEQLFELFQNHYSGTNYSQIIKCYQQISADYPRCSIAWWRQFQLVCCQNFDVNRYIRLHVSQIIDHSFMDELTYLRSHSFYKFAFKYASDIEKQHYRYEFDSFYYKCSGYYEQRNLIANLKKDDWTLLKGVWISEKKDKKINPSYLEFWHNDSCIYLIIGKRSGKNLSFARLSYHQADETCDVPYFKIISSQDDFPWSKQIPIHPLSSINRLCLGNITYCRPPEDFEVSTFQLKLIRLLVYIGIQLH